MSQRCRAQIDTSQPISSGASLIAVGGKLFSREVREKLGITATHRTVVQTEVCDALHEPVAAYAGDFEDGMIPLSTENRPFWGR